MRVLRFFLFPLSIVYMLVTSIRNLCFDLGLFHSKTYDVPSLGIGNLTVGGTGKSVAISYFINEFMSAYPITVLSRGYGRLSKGYQLADAHSTAETIGDEPMMFLNSFPTIRIAVANQRREGMKQLLSDSHQPKGSVFLWDDCFQHRWVKPKVMILLTTFSKPYTKDFLLPVGQLRELSEGAQRADVIIVTKCPKDISEGQKKVVQQQLQLKRHQSLFFATIVYSDNMYNRDRSLPLNMLEKVPFLLVTGIADPKLLVDYLNGKFLNYEHLAFSDHHLFSTKDIKRIREKSNGCVVLTTEKDYVRLRSKFDSELLFYLPIKMKILDERAAELHALVSKKMGLH